MAKKPPKFEEALARLEQIVEAIEQGKVGLEESLVRYAEGMELIRHCRGILGEAEKKIEILTQQQDGSLAAEEAEEGQFTDPGPATNGTERAPSGASE